MTWSPTRVRSFPPKQAVLVLVAVCFVLAPTSALGFEIETSVTSGCHEQITSEALARAGWPEGHIPPALTNTDKRIANDLPFAIPSGGAADPWILALLIGVRHNDVRNADPFDLAALTFLHNDPALQSEHCLRRRQDDGLQGDEQALGACRAFILGELAIALGEEEDLETMDVRVEVETHLVFRGKVPLQLVRYPFHLGRALHALEDSYTHAFRDPSNGRVRSVLNWIDGNIGSNYDSSRDGHPHVAEMDRCGGSNMADELRKRWAITAVADLMAALNDPTGGRSGRLARAEAVLEAHMVVEPGCTASNDWCDSAEAGLTSGCSSPGAPSGGMGFWFAVAIVWVGLGVRRHRKIWPLLAFCVVGIFLIRPAAAQDAPDPTEQAPATTPDTASTPVAEQEGAEEDAPANPGAETPGGEDAGDAPTARSLEHEAREIKRMPDRVTRTWGGAVSAGASFNQGAGAVSAGLRWNPVNALGLGLDLEYNPWVSISAGRVAPGAASLYVPITWRFKRFGTWDLRTTFSLGATMILFELVGVDRGTIGAFVGWNPLGLSMPLGPDVKLIIKPADLAVSAPQLKGIPYYYYQYRFTIGIEWYP